MLVITMSRNSSSLAYTRLWKAVQGLLPMGFFASTSKQIITMQGGVLGYCDAHHLIVSLDAGPGLAFTSARLLIPVVDNLPADWPGQAQI